MATFKRIRTMLNEYERISYVKNILTRLNFTLNCNNKNYLKVLHILPQSSHKKIAMQILNLVCGLKTGFENERS